MSDGPLRNRFDDEYQQIAARFEAGETGTALAMTQELFKHVFDRGRQGELAHLLSVLGRLKSKATDQEARDAVEAWTRRVSDELDIRARQRRLTREQSELEAFADEVFEVLPYTGARAHELSEDYDWDIVWVSRALLLLVERGRVEVDEYRYYPRDRSGPRRTDPGHLDVHPFDRPGEDPSDPGAR